VLVPVKELHVAKTRLDRPDRPDIALAMARDTVRAAAAAASVAEVVVVTDDPRALQALQAPGVRILPDSPRAGLNAALQHAADWVRLTASGASGASVAALSADLPALRPAELDLALAAAAKHDRAFLADAAGTGTVLLTATAHHHLCPEYGPDSRQAHVASGAYDLTSDIGDRVPGLRRDVDTVADLSAAALLGTGPATSSLS
jgi:2-phospho-L-lactate/phosphoenolpyruvate guanylyltransferase